jgi:hypothetical protein
MTDNARDRLAAGIEAAQNEYEQAEARDRAARGRDWEQFDLDSCTIRVGSAHGRAALVIDGATYDLDPDEAQEIGAALIRAAQTASA